MDGETCREIVSKLLFCRSHGVPRVISEVGLNAEVRAHARDMPVGFGAVAGEVSVAPKLKGEGYRTFPRFYNKIIKF